MSKFVSFVVVFFILLLFYKPSEYFDNVITTCKSMLNDYFVNSETKVCVKYNDNNYCEDYIDKPMASKKLHTEPHLKAVIDLEEFDNRNLDKLYYHGWKQPQLNELNSDKRYLQANYGTSINTTMQKYL